MNDRRWLIVSRGLCGGTAFGQLVTLPAVDEASLPFRMAGMIAAGIGWMLFDRELRLMARRNE